MALAEEPLRYMRKYLAVEEDLDDEDTAASSEIAVAAPKPAKAAAKKASTQKRQPKPMPTGLPDFLKRPYR